MKNPQTAMWTVGALLVATLLAVLAYFVAIAPELNGAATAKEGQQKARERNDLLDVQIAGVKAKAKEVPLWQGEMAAIAIDLPATAEQSELHRLITDILAARGLPAVALAYGAPQAILPPVPEAAPVVAPETDIADGTVEGTTVATPTPEPSPAPADPAAPGASPSAALDDVKFEGLVGIPVTITTEGAPAAVMGLIADLYAQDDRFLTITAVDLRRAEVSEEVVGRRALTTSDWVVTISYYAFSLLDEAKSFPDDSGEKTPPYIDGTALNPFVPIPGTLPE